MQAPTPSSVASSFVARPLSENEMDLFQDAANLVYNAAKLGEAKFGERGIRLVEDAKDFFSSIFGTDHIAAVGELGRHSSPVYPPTYTPPDYLKEVKAHKEKEAEADVPTFMLWAPKASRFVERKVWDRVNTFQKATIENVRKLLKYIRQGKACYSQIPYGQRGKTRDQVSAMLDKAELIVLSILGHQNLA